MGRLPIAPCEEATHHARPPPPPKFTAPGGGGPASSPSSGGEGLCQIWPSLSAGGVGGVPDLAIPECRWGGGVPELASPSTGGKRVGWRGGAAAPYLAAPEQQLPVAFPYCCRRWRRWRRRGERGGEGRRKEEEEERKRENERWEKALWERNERR
uniref:Uncharacterized protein n=1 Tax=Oryza rufipogon TaxID=4529 RepID=A0A0E0R4X4_ORYRU